MQNNIPPNPNLPFINQNRFNGFIGLILLGQYATISTQHRMLRDHLNLQQAEMERLLKQFDDKSFWVEFFEELDRNPKIENDLHFLNRWIYGRLVLPLHEVEKSSHDVLNKTDLSKKEKQLREQKKAQYLSAVAAEISKKRSNHPNNNRDGNISDQRTFGSNNIDE
jgi:hypothetical protein